MKIKECPCCGGEASIFKEGYFNWYSVKCIDKICNIGTPLCGTVNEVIKIWNNRYKD